MHDYPVISAALVHAYLEDEILGFSLTHILHGEVDDYEPSLLLPVQRAMRGSEKSIAKKQKNASCKKTYFTLLLEEVLNRYFISDYNLIYNYIVYKVQRYWKIGNCEEKSLEGLGESILFKYFVPRKKVELFSSYFQIPECDFCTYECARNDGKTNSVFTKSHSSELEPLDAAHSEVLLSSDKSIIPVIVADGFGVKMWLRCLWIFSCIQDNSRVISVPTAVSSGAVVEMEDKIAKMNTESTETILQQIRSSREALSNCTPIPISSHTLIPDHPFILYTYRKEDEPPVLHIDDFVEETRESNTNSYHVTNSTTKERDFVENHIIAVKGAYHGLYPLSTATNNEGGGVYQHRNENVSHVFIIPRRPLFSPLQYAVLWGPLESVLLLQKKVTAPVDSCCTIIRNIKNNNILVLPPAAGNAASFDEIKSGFSRGTITYSNLVFLSRAIFNIHRPIFKFAAPFWATSKKEDSNCLEQPQMKNQNIYYTVTIANNKDYYRFWAAASKKECSCDKFTDEAVNFRRMYENPELYALEGAEQTLLHHPSVRHANLKSAERIIGQMLLDEEDGECAKETYMSKMFDKSYTNDAPETNEKFDESLYREINLSGMIDHSFIIDNNPNILSYKNEARKLTQDAREKLKRLQSISFDEKDNKKEKQSKFENGEYSSFIDQSESKDHNVKAEFNNCSSPALNILPFSDLHGLQHKEEPEIDRYSTNENLFPRKELPSPYRVLLNTDYDKLLIPEKKKKNILTLEKSKYDDLNIPHIHRVVKDANPFGPWYETLNIFSNNNLQ